MSDQNENIKCVVRIRPANEQELKINSICVQKLDDSNTIRVESKLKSDPRNFSLDLVFPPNTKQIEIYKDLALPILDSFYRGYNCSILAYGQTGSGKSHTMIGPSVSLFNENFDENLGLIPRILRDIFSQIERIKSNTDIKSDTNEMNIVNSVIVKCSCIELYQEHMIDLLNYNNSEGLIIREDLKRGMYIEGVTEKSLQNPKEAIEAILLGMKNRHVAATNMNSESSRSHLIFTIFLQVTLQDEKGLVKTRDSRMHLVDLAGSERQKTSGSTGERIKEAGMINKSLFTLGNVINSLVESSGEGKSKFVPFRDSKLTYYLKDSLGGNSMTTIIGNISPSVINVQETLSTLYFVQRAKQIKNKAIINENVSGTLLLLQEEIKRLKEELALISNNCDGCSRRKSTSIQINEIIKDKKETDPEEILQLCRNEIKEFCIKFEKMMDLQKSFNEKIANLGKLSKPIQEINEIRKSYKKDSRNIINELERKLNQFEHITKLKEGFMNEFKNQHFDKKDLCIKIEKFLSEISNFKNSIIENLLPGFKSAIDEKWGKVDSEKLSKIRVIEENLSGFNSTNINSIISTLNEFITSNQKVDLFFKENIEIYVKDKKIDTLLFQVDEYKINEENLKRSIIELQNENFLLSMEMQKYKNFQEYPQNQINSIENDKSLKNYQNYSSQEDYEVQNWREEEIQRLNLKINQMTKKLEDNEYTIKQQKDDLDVLFESNFMFENKIKELKAETESREEYYLRTEKTAEKLKSEITVILDIIRSISEENQQNLFNVNTITSSLNQNQWNINRTFENLWNQSSSLAQQNLMIRKDISFLDELVNKNIKENKELIKQKEEFEYKLLEKTTKIWEKYKSLMTKIKNNDPKKPNNSTNNIMIVNNNNYNHNENSLIAMNLKNFMKYFDKKMEYFSKIYMNKFKNQKEKIERIKKSFSKLQQDKMKKQFFMNEIEINECSGFTLKSSFLRKIDNADFDTQIIIEAYEDKISQLNSKIERMAEELEFFNHSSKFKEEIKFKENQINEYKNKLELMENQAKFGFNNSYEEGFLNKSDILPNKPNSGVQFNELIQGILKINVKFKEKIDSKQEMAFRVISVLQEKFKGNPILIENTKKTFNMNFNKHILTNGFKKN